jgi:hypothetical protein
MHHNTTEPPDSGVAQASPARMRVGDIGDVTGVGPCWRLTYARCEHVQEFARIGLEDPERLALYVERNFAQCLTCRLRSARPEQTSLEQREPCDIVEA